MSEPVTRTMSGMVFSAKMDKTATVLVERRGKHPVYGKYIKHSKKFHVHDPENQCQEGDEVTIEEAKKMSKTKLDQRRSTQSCRQSPGRERRN